MPPRADALILALGLRPHPEGGHFREVFRSSARVAPADGRGGRAALTVIYFLLARGDRSRWHVVASDEQWTFLEGEPIELLVADPESVVVERHRLGPLAAGGAPTVVVPAGHWQAARPVGAYGLVTCSVGPGFDFADFTLLAEEPDSADRVRRAMSDLADLL